MKRLLVIAAVLAMVATGVVLLSRDRAPEPDRNVPEVTSGNQQREPAEPKINTPGERLRLAAEGLAADAGHPQIERSSANVYVQLAPATNPDSSRAWHQARIERFMSEAKLTEEQSQKFLALLYDLKVNLQAAQAEALRDHTPELAPGESMPLEEYEERQRGPGADGGAGLMKAANAALADEAEARAREFLSESQLDELRRIIGALPIMASFLTFTDGSTVLPTPMK